MKECPRCKNFRWNESNDKKSFEGKEPIFILDIDGVMTTGNFFQDENGKFAKEFGADDTDLLKLIEKEVPLHFISGDKKGFRISQRRIEEDCGWILDLVPVKANERLNWINANYPKDKYFRIFMGDGWADYIALRNVNYSITTDRALAHTKYNANFVTSRGGGDRAVAEACLHLMDLFNLKSPW
jgi:3-deoxy-D-manno-octulosonate 8-phosphate phosphatase (KDO 8-P phosphatase)